MKDFVTTLEKEFRANTNTKVAMQQKAYMKGHFEFFGMKAAVRRETQKPFFVKEYLPPKQELESIVKTLWSKPERDFQLFAQELVHKYAKRFEKKDIALLEYMVVNKSWWDTVDFIAYKSMGEYFEIFPEERKRWVKKWIASDNIWLQRAALLFQLNYKENLDTALLTHVINSLLGSKEFFINKAIGWVLRQYSRTNPGWVIDFVAKTELANLSRREALRLIRS